MHKKCENPLTTHGGPCIIKGREEKDKKKGMERDSPPPGNFYTRHAREIRRPDMIEAGRAAKMNRL